MAKIWHGSIGALKRKALPTLLKICVRSSLVGLKMSLALQLVQLRGRLEMDIATWYPPSGLKNPMLQLVDNAA